MGNEARVIVVFAEQVNNYFYYFLAGSAPASDVRHLDGLVPRRADGACPERSRRGALAATISRDFLPAPAVTEICVCSAGQITVEELMLRRFPYAESGHPAGHCSHSSVSETTPALPEKPDFLNKLPVNSVPVQFQLAVRRGVVCRNRRRPGRQLRRSIQR